MESAVSTSSRSPISITGGQQGLLNEAWSRNAQGLRRMSRLDSILDWSGLAARSKFKAAALASNCHVSERQLRRFVFWRFKLQLHEWLELQRMECALRMLRNGFSVKEAADSAGFAHAANFARAFRRQFKTNPTSFRAAVPARPANILGA